MVTYRFTEFGLAGTESYISLRLVRLRSLFWTLGIEETFIGESRGRSRVRYAEELYGRVAEFPADFGQRLAECWR